jgi:hypothetical protein
LIALVCSIALGNGPVAMPVARMQSAKEFVRMQPQGCKSGNVNLC